jgi:polar amino acid transport system permease protein
LGGKIEALEVLWSALPRLLAGVRVTVELTALFLGVGLVSGFLVAVAQVYGRGPLRWGATVFEQVFRGVPALVLLFLFYFGLTEVGISRLAAAVLALGLRSGAYQSQIFRGALLAVPTGQLLAARALGMTGLQTIRHVVLPQAIRLALPGWSNEYAIVLKDTSYVFAIGLVELMREGTYIVARTFGRYSLEVYLFVALVYLVLVYGGNLALSLLARRLAIPGQEARAESLERM